jgi:hypothetical protein
MFERIRGTRVGDQSTPVEAVTMSCPCGHSVVLSAGQETAECDCGRIYTVTITQLRGPDGEEPPESPK